MNNIKVLACQIDEKLQKEMKEYVTKEGITVKSYITGLIKEDLEKKAIQENSKETSKKQIAEEKTKQDSNKKTVKKNLKEEEEEFE